MRLVRLLVLLIVGLATLPACAMPCHAGGEQAGGGLAGAGHAVHRMAHHRATERAVHGMAETCIGCGIVLPVPILPAPARAIAIRYDRPAQPALAGRDPIATAPPPRA